MEACRTRRLARLSSHLEDKRSPNSGWPLCLWTARTSRRIFAERFFLYSGGASLYSPPTSSGVVDMAGKVRSSVTCSTLVNFHGFFCLGSHSSCASCFRIWARDTFESGLHDPTFSDIAPLSHELSEIFNDPFVDNATPWYLSPSGNCQNNPETRDGIEGLPHAQYTITLNGVT